MGHRPVRIQGLGPGQGHLAPGAVLVLAPIERMTPALALDRGPAVGEPILRIGVAAGLDEGQPFAIGHQPLRQAEGLQIDRVARALVIEGKARPAVAQGRQAAGMGGVGQRPRIGRRAGGGMAIDRRAGHLGEQVEHVHQDQLLMLLFMRQAQIEQGQELCVLAGWAFQQRGHGRVHMAAIGAHLGQGRAGDQAAGGTRMTRAGGFVIGVEQIGEGRVERPIGRIERRQDEGLEEPAGMGLVPFDRAGVRHGLHHLVLGRQGRGQGQGAGAHGGVAGG